MGDLRGAHLRRPAGERAYSAVSANREISGRERVWVPSDLRSPSSERAYKDGGADGRGVRLTMVMTCADQAVNVLTAEAKGGDERAAERVRLTMSIALRRPSSERAYTADGGDADEVPCV